MAEFKELKNLELPLFLQESLNNWKTILKENENNRWDCCYCELQSNINICETEQLISSEIAWYLREQYLGLKQE